MILLPRDDEFREFKFDGEDRVCVYTPPLVSSISLMMMSSRARVFPSVLADVAGLCVSEDVSVGHHYSDMVSRHEHDASCDCFVVFCWENYITHEILGTQHSIVLFRFIPIPVPFFAKNPETEISLRNKN